MTKRKNKTITIMLIIFISAIAIPILIGCFYILPVSDDFQNSIGWVNDTGNKIVYIINYCKNIYNTWQGNYTGLPILAIPVYYLFGVTGIRIVAIVVFVAFVFSLFLLAKNIVTILKINNKINATLLLLLLILFYIFSENNYFESFYWYTGIVAYTIPLIFAIMSINFYFFYENNKSRVYLIFSFVFAFLGAGGTLNISSLLCSSLLLINIYRKLTYQKLTGSIYVFAIALLGSIINAAAPGNFVRHTYFDNGKIDILNSLLQSTNNIITRLNTDYSCGILLLIVVITFLVFHKTLKGSDIEFKYPVLLVLGCFVIMVMVDFPVVFGYNGASFTERTKFIEGFTIIIFVLTSTIYVAGWLAQKMKVDFGMKEIIIIGIICSLPISYNFSEIKQNKLTPLKAFKHIVIGDFAAEEERQMNYIKQIEESNDEDVVVYGIKFRDEFWTNLDTPNLSKNAENFHNKVMASYFNKKSIRLENNEDSVK